MHFRQVEKIPYSQFITDLEQDKIKAVVLSHDEIAGEFKNPPKDGPDKFIAVRVEDPRLVDKLIEKKVDFSAIIEDTFFRDLLSWVIPIMLFFGVWMFLVNRAEKNLGPGGSGGLMAIGRSKAKVYMEEDVKVTFDDVAGVDEAKEELTEVVQFLKEPQRYSRLGGRLPKGVLLVGPPGTGKTLLAKAVAGEASVPFFSISGSEFVEMFVGVGAARVRDMFEQARAKAPCIIFIDELDALGRARGANPMLGSHDEKEQTLNQLLVEMDGFDSRIGIIVLSATNRPEILDSALLRAGRFDRQVLVDRPDRKGRAEILKVHLKHVVVEETIDIDQLAAITAGFTGADLENLVNESALLAARRNADRVAMSDFNEAIERIVAGLEKKNRLLNAQERTIVAYHESGHALVALAIPGSDPVHKVSIIPRGMGALGYTMQRPTEDRFLMSKQELLNKITVLLGGRTSELLKFSQISTGAADDLEKATDIARSMITRFGMTDELGLVTYESQPSTFLGGRGYEFMGNGRRFSEETAREIDLTARAIVDDCFDRAKAILTANKDALEEAAQLLLKQETITHEELVAAVGAVHEPTRSGM